MADRMAGIPPDAQRLSPGFYSTADGAMHVDLEEFIVAGGGDPRDPQDRATAERVIDEICADLEIPVSAAQPEQEGP